MKCPLCNGVFTAPGAQRAGRIGGKARGRKGFAVASQPTAEARRRGWIKRKKNVKGQSTE